MVNQVKSNGSLEWDLAGTPCVTLKFYLDDDSADTALVKALQSRGFQVVKPEAAGLRGANDFDHLQYCSQRGFVLLSHNIGEFQRLHREFLSKGKHQSGIILMRQQTLGIGEKLRRLVRISNSRTAHDMKDNIEFLSNW